MEDIALPAKVIAQLIGVTVARVGQLARDGIVTRNDDGTYPATSITQYITWIKRPQGKADGGKDYRRLLEKEKYREKRRENDIEDGLVAPVSLLTDAIVKSANIIMPVLETLPLEIKRSFPEITGGQAHIIKKAIAVCRNAIADMGLIIE